VPDKDPDIRIAIFHSIRLLGVWTAVLYGVVALALVAGLIFANSQRNDLRDVQDETVTALCTFRDDLQRRYDDGIKFLVNHPEGIPGISAADIQRSLENQRATLKSLAELPCPATDSTDVLGQTRVRQPRSRFIDAVNRERGCGDLRSTGKYLTRSARRHSRQMAHQDRLFHSTLRVGHWSKVGEVVGVGPHWQSIFVALMDSREHRRILRDCQYDFIAVGIVSAGGRVWLTGRLYAR